LLLLRLKYLEESALGAPRGLSCGIEDVVDLEKWFRLSLDPQGHGAMKLAYCRRRLAAKLQTQRHAGAASPPPPQPIGLITEDEFLQGVESSTVLLQVRRRLR